MARLRWVAATMRAWAAWTEGYGTMKSQRLDGLPACKRYESWMPKDALSVRRTHQALSLLDVRDRETLMLVYLIGPRARKVTVAEIARWARVKDSTLRYRLAEAEMRLSELLDDHGEGSTGDRSDDSLSTIAKGGA